MTEPSRRHGTERGAWSPRVWGLCVLAGLLLVTLGAALSLHRGNHTRTGRAIPLVNSGRLPPDSSGSADTRSSAARARRDGAQARASIPAGSRLRLARLGLDAPITRVAAVDNVMQIPRDPHTLGWWTGGAAPGDAKGNTVIVGHVNYSGVAGAFSVLPDTRPGDTLVLTAAGHAYRYRVLATRSYPKATGIPAEVFSRTGPARLVLITCGGTFDGATGNYQDNIVAYAQPV